MMNDETKSDSTSKPCSQDDYDASFIDTHCHLDLCCSSKKTFQELVVNANNSNVRHIIIPGLNPGQWPEIEQLSHDKTIRISYGIGIHPWYIDRFDINASKLQDSLENFIKNKNTQNLVCIGECGLDGTIKTPMQTQLDLLTVQITIANELQLPVIIHSHRANEPLVKILKAFPPKAGGVIHAFSGSYDLAMQYHSRGLHLGIGGTITYPRARKTRATVSALPVDALLLETDAPDMPIHGYQGQPNLPERILFVAQEMAKLKKLSMDTVMRETSRNAIRCFNL
jgi:TatD DNase family protein